MIAEPSRKSEDESELTDEDIQTEHATDRALTIANNVKEWLKGWRNAPVPIPEITEIGGGNVKLAWESPEGTAEIIVPAPLLRVKVTRAGMETEVRLLKDEHAVIEVMRLFRDRKES